MSNLHQEHHFETEICAHLAAHGWLHADGDAVLFVTAVTGQIDVRRA